MKSLFDSLVPRIAPLLAAASLLPALAAQCELTWQPFSPLAGADSRVTCLATLPSGDLVAGGWFKAIGSIQANHIARWDGTAWSPLGAGPGSWLPPGGGEIMALLALPNGDLLASGGFGVELWNGTAWTLLGGAYPGAVLALCRLPNGDIIAGGSFQFVAGQVIPHLARWNGTAWSALGSSIDNGEVRALAVLPNGDVAIGGTFSSIGGTPMGALAVWNGTTFAPLGLTGGVVHALQVLPTGELLIGAGGLPATLLRWNGTTLVPVTPPLTGPVTALRVETNGDWIVGGTNLFQSTPGTNLVRYSGGTRTVLGGTADTVFALGEHNNRLVAGRGPNANIELIDPTIESFDGVAWTPLGGPANALVDVLLADRVGGLYAGGRFTAIAGVPANNIARWDGAAWSALGAGVDGAVTHLELTSDGDVIAAGSFTHAGSVPVNGMARWDGATWTSLQNTQGPNSFACGPFGEIVTMQLDGTVRVLTAGQWTTLPPVPVQQCTDVVVTGNGTIVVSCVSSSPMVPAMLWNGLAWQPMGTGLFNGQVALDSAGKLMLVGNYNASGTLFGWMMLVLDWNGSQWVQRTSELTGGFSDVLALPDGDLLLVGAFSAGTPYWGIARWHVNGWQTVDGGLSLEMGPYRRVKSIAMTSDGEVFVAGNFALAGSVVSARLAKATTNCPATVTTVGAGCAGSAGPVALAALDRPWLGAAFHTEGTGFASAGFAIQAVGTPAPAITLPLGAAGCLVHVAPLVLDVLLPSAGVVGTELDVPLQPSLVGLALRMQLFGVEIPGAGLLLTSSNALDFVIGAL